MASNTSRAGLGGRPAPGLRMYILSGHRARRNQRLHPLPELIGYDPRLDTFHHDLYPAPRQLRLESRV